MPVKSSNRILQQMLAEDNKRQMKEMYDWACEMLKQPPPKITWSWVAKYRAEKRDE
jgi:hypothetical protein